MFLELLPSGAALLLDHKEQLGVVPERPQVIELVAPEHRFVQRL